MGLFGSTPNARYTVLIKIEQNMDYCCSEFKAVATGRNPATLSPASIVYKAVGLNHGRPMIEPSDNGWAVVGCCEGCWMLNGVRFCPFCGASICE